ncbi:MAG: C40 family peptidase [Acidobacteriota bacterium]|nr:C40 family peptidase [Acidobacteriota bacterium]
MTARSVLLLAGLAAFSGGCASTTASRAPLPYPGSAGPVAAAPLPAPGPAVTPAVPLGPPPDGHDIAEAALRQEGRPYRLGGETPAGFDCSGLVQYVFAEYGLELPREVRDQYRVGRAVARRAIRPGDLLFFHTTSRGPSHVGIAIGGGRFVHAPNARGTVRVSALGAPYWSRRFIGARRIDLRDAVPASGTAAPPSSSPRHIP